MAFRAERLAQSEMRWWSGRNWVMRNAEWVVRDETGAERWEQRSGRVQLSGGSGVGGVAVRG